MAEQKKKVVRKSNPKHKEEVLDLNKKEVQEALAHMGKLALASKKLSDALDEAKVNDAHVRAQGKVNTAHEQLKVYLK